MEDPALKGPLLEGKIQNMIEDLIKFDEDEETNESKNSLESNQRTPFDSDSDKDEEKKESDIDKDLLFNNYNRSHIPYLSSTLNFNQNSNIMTNNPNLNSRYNLNSINDDNSNLIKKNCHPLYINNSSFQNINSNYNLNLQGFVNNKKNNNSCRGQDGGKLIISNFSLYNNKAYNSFNFNNIINLYTYTSSNIYNSISNMEMNSSNNRNPNIKYIFNNTFSNKQIINSNALYINNNNYFEMEMMLNEVNKTDKIDDICYNRIKGHFGEILRTHKGSRIFQNLLKNTHNDILHQIFLELKEILPILLRDQYANYFCKTFFELLNKRDRIEYLYNIQKELGSLAIDDIATYPVQDIIENLGNRIERTILYIGIKNYISNYCFNTYGVHILEKILSCFEKEFTQEIIKYVYNNFLNLANHMNGIFIVKKILSMTHKKELQQQLKLLIIKNALNLIIHKYGNYVIQVIVQNWDNNDLDDILNLYKNHYVYLSKQKYSSNVIERIIEKNKTNLELYINGVCSTNSIYEIIINRYGNYVIQKALKLSSGEIRLKLMKEISKNIHKIEDKKIVEKWKFIIYRSNLLNCK